MKEKLPISLPISLPFRLSTAAFVWLLKGISDEPTAYNLCIYACHEYLIEPSDWTREVLRKAYEAVPAHERVYLGSMNDRGRDYRRILLTPERKCEV